MDYDFLIEVLGLIKCYEDDSKVLQTSCSPKGLAEYILKKDDVQNITKNPQAEKRINAEIARDISLIHRYVRGYIQRALKDSSLNTLEEYSYLATLLGKGTISKTELNNINAIEKTTGSEIIRRLHKKGLVQFSENPHDGRSVNVSITVDGRNELISLFPKFQRATDILLHSLSFQAKINLRELHQLICKSNEELFLSHRDDTLDELLDSCQGHVND